MGRGADAFNRYAKLRATQEKTPARRVELERIIRERVDSGYVVDTYADEVLPKARSGSL